MKLYGRGLFVDAETTRALPEYRYIQKIKQIQDIGKLSEHASFYINSLDQERIELHKEVLKSHFLDPEDSDVYIKTKAVFDNLDKVVEACSTCHEEKLETERDVLFCAAYLHQFIAEPFFGYYMRGQISLEQLLG